MIDASRKVASSLQFFAVCVVIPAVKEPGSFYFQQSAREFYPLEVETYIFSRADVAHLPFLPIGTSSGQSVGQQFPGLRNRRSAQRDRAIGGQRVWID